MQIRLLHIVLFLFTAFYSNAQQYYLRGEVKNENNQPLSNVKIILHSNHSMYYSGYSGGFGITTKTLIDSLTFLLDGYETKTVKVNADQWQNIGLKITTAKNSRNHPKLISVTKDLGKTEKFHWFINNETYFQMVENEYIAAEKYPNTGFSLSVNKASYSNIRRFINMGSTAPPDAVRIEELMNYFNLNYKEPAKNETFFIQSQLSTCPWDVDKQLLFLNINAKKLDLDKIPPGNFVFLIDASGSMDMPNRLPLLQSAFQLFVKNLRPIDTVSIVTYGGTVSVWLPPTCGSEKEKIIRSIEEITANGETPGMAAITTAYKLAQSTFNKKGTNRVILATDGDFNVGASSEAALDELITKERLTGVFLTCLGVGMGNFKDSKLETLAKRGNGNYAYLDNIVEAEKVLVKELTQTLYAVADDAFLNMQFNAEFVKNYRLIGFDNKRDAVADSSIDLEGGEVGSGSSIMAIFEIEPQNIFDIQKLDTITNNKIAIMTLRYSLCGDSSHQEIKYLCNQPLKDFLNINKDYKFATSIAMFGLKIKQSKYLKNCSWYDIEKVTALGYKETDFLQMEFVRLLERAKKIYKTGRRK